MLELLVSPAVTDSGGEDLRGDTRAAESCSGVQRAAEVGRCSVRIDCAVCADGRAGGRLETDYT